MLRQRCGKITTAYIHYITLQGVHATTPKLQRWSNVVSTLESKFYLRFTMIVVLTMLLQRRNRYVEFTTSSQRQY